MPKAYALLRAGFPYLATLGMRRVTSFATDVAIGDEGRLYALCRTEAGPHVRRLNWDDEDLGPIEGFTWPVALVRDRAENLYVADEATSTIAAFTRQGESLGKWGTPGSAPGELARPSGLAFDANENLLVSDTQNHRIQKFTKEGALIEQWGIHGSAPGELDLPWGITVDDEGDVFVADWGNNRIQKFDATGRFIMALGRAGSGDGELRRPSSVAVDQHGDIYVCDRGNNRVQLFDHRGRYVQKFLGDATLSKMGRRYVLANHKTLRLREMANLEPQKLFRAPTAVRLDDEGRMYVADQASHRIQVYRKEAYVLGPDEILPELSAPTLLTT